MVAALVARAAGPQPVNGGIPERGQLIPFPRPSLAEHIDSMDAVGYEVFSVAVDASRDLSLADQRRFRREAERLLSMALDPLPRRRWWSRR